MIGCEISTEDSERQRGRSMEGNVKIAIRKENDV
jgi:hypothetical protein